MLSTRLSSSAWVSPSIQCRSSRTRASGCRWLSRTSSALRPSRVRRRRCGGSSACQAASSTGRSSRASTAGRIGRSALVQQQDLAQHLLGAAPPVVARRDVEVGLEQIDHRRPGARAARGDRSAFEHQPGAHPRAVGELVEQPRLAHARIADQGDDLALAGRGQLARPIERRQFVPAADEGREAPAGRCLEARARRTDAHQIERLDRLRQALHRHLPQRPQVDEAFGEACGRRGQPDRSGARQLLHPARQMDGRADRVVVHAEVVADRADQDLARMQADPGADLDAAGAAQLGRLDAAWRAGSPAPRSRRARRGPHARSARRTAP